MGEERVVVVVVAVAVVVVGENQLAMCVRVSNACQSL